MLLVKGGIVLYETVIERHEFIGTRKTAPWKIAPKHIHPGILPLEKFP